MPADEPHALEFLDPAWREGYVARMFDVCRTADPPFVVREVPLPVGLASPLQPAYPENILVHERILDGDGAREVRMPDVNAMWVVEKVQR
jgi:hypothetical protein